MFAARDGCASALESSSSGSQRIGGAARDGWACAEASSSGSQPRVRIVSGSPSLHTRASVNGTMLRQLLRSWLAHDQMLPVRKKSC
mmetsp:Transcript_1009/g.2896  ORF Transcript_1009/g.2896 Transcript_1009/m.2896 type:complete len:86 (+) Transcript_1009:1095-1352(+)